VGNNNFQANYEGGDGHHFTLTVVPYLCLQFDRGAMARMGNEVRDAIRDISMIGCFTSQGGKNQLYFESAVSQPFLRQKSRV